MHLYKVPASHFTWSIFQFVITITFYTALIPQECVEFVGKGDKSKCCPVPNGFQKACGSPERGTCDEIKEYINNIPKKDLPDDRFNWPIQYFRYVCKCKGNFFGPSCSDCWYGWTGENCDKKEKIAVRRDLLTYSSEEKEIFQKVLEKSITEPSKYMVFDETGNGDNDIIGNPEFRKVPVYEMYVFIHNFVGVPECKKFGSSNFGHEGQSFTVWHRQYLLAIERDMRQIAEKYFDIKDFTLPYWDWTDKTECEICTEDMIGDNDKLKVNQSKFSHWKEYCPQKEGLSKCYRCQAKGEKMKTLHREFINSKFPESDDVEYTLSMKKFSHKDDGVNHVPCYSFANALEGFCAKKKSHTKQKMHNQVHRMVNGTFYSAKRSASDPLFLMHHTQLDRLLQKWFIKAHRSSSDFPMHTKKLGQGKNDYLVGFIPLVTPKKMYTNTEDLGYTYDNLRFGKIE